jgi:hypothetical protein
MAKKLNAIAMSVEAQEEGSEGAEGFTEEQKFFIQALMGGNKSGGPAAAGSTPGQQMRCFKCRKLGHTANECKKPDPRECYGCGEVGHLKRECPKRAGGAQKAAAQADKGKND